MPTIYVLTYEISGDRYVSVFATAEEREACAWNVIASLAEDGGLDPADVPRGDLNEAWDYVRSDDVDGMWLDSDEMTDAVAAASPSVAPPSDAPAPADPVKAEMLAVLDAMWKFATTMAERHGMNGDSTMTDADHAAWQDAAGKASSVIARAEGRA